MVVVVVVVAVATVVVAEVASVVVMGGVGTVASDSILEHSQNFFLILLGSKPSIQRFSSTVENNLLVAWNRSSVSQDFAQLHLYDIMTGVV